MQRQGAGDGDALALAAGELMRTAVEQMGDAEQFDGLVQRLPVHGVADALHAVGQIAARAQMREEAGLLKDVAERALVGRQEGPAVLPDLAVDAQIAVRHAHQPGDQTQQAGLAGAGVTEERGDAPTGQRQIHVERELRVVEMETGLDLVDGHGGGQNLRWLGLRV